MTSRLYMMAISPRNLSMRNMNHHQITSPSFLPITCPSLLAQYHEGFDHYKSSSSSILSLNSTFTNDGDFEQLPHSWSQLLVDEDKFGFSHHYRTSKKDENWENQIIRNQPVIRGVPNNIGDHIKQENSQSSQLFGSTQRDFDDDQEIISNNIKNTCNESLNWSHQQEVMQVSPPSRKSLGRNSFVFSSSKTLDWRTQSLHHSTECNSASTGGVYKKAKIQSSPTQPPLKIRKEKLGERITNLHQTVSPYGKTDTASVLLETIGTIRTLQGQIEALSSPYLSNASTNMRPNQNGDQDELKDLKSRGLCLVPVSCIHHIGDDNRGDYWAPAPGGAF